MRIPLISLPETLSTADGADLGTHSSEVWGVHSCLKASLCSVSLQEMRLLVRIQHGQDLAPGPLGEHMWLCAVSWKVLCERLSTS